jgi:hypothetical protein|tara:strand:+ start:5840 stop:6073 length:234 start_codon:yes stop_codon:yes gene_type:complete
MSSNNIQFNLPKGHIPKFILCSNVAIPKIGQTVKFYDEIAPLKVKKIHWLVRPINRSGISLRDDNYAELLCKIDLDQ